MNNNYQANNKNGEVMPQENVDKMLSEAGQNIGKKPAELVQQVKDGKIDEVIKSLPSDKAQMVQELLNDPEKAEKLMQTPQAKMIMKMLLKNDTNPKSN